MPIHLLSELEIALNCSVQKETRASILSLSIPVPSLQCILNTHPLPTSLTSLLEPQSRTPLSNCRRQIKKAPFKVEKNKDMSRSEKTLEFSSMTKSRDRTPVPAIPSV